MTGRARFVVPAIGIVFFLIVAAVAMGDWWNGAGNPISRPAIDAIEAHIGTARQTESIVRRDHGEVRRQVYWQNGLPIKIVERFDLGGNTGEIASYFADGTPLRVDRAQSFMITQGGGAGERVRSHMVIDYENDRFLAGWKSVNGGPSEPDEHEIRASYRYAQDTYEEVVSPVERPR